MIIQISIIVFLSLFDNGHSNLQQSCGVPLTSTRIVGGYNMMYYKYPWFASLQNDGSHMCGGTLIAPGVILTAAHCYASALGDENLMKSYYTVTLGVYKNCDTDEKHQRTYKVNKVHVHEFFKLGLNRYDIAMVILDGDTSAYTPACLPVNGLHMQPREAYIQGLGDIGFKNHQYPCELREARLWIYPDDVCVKILRERSEEGLPAVFCAGYLEGKIDSCQGDSGGPLVVVDSDNKYVLLGITSFGFGCGDKDMLGVYTDVFQHLPWIEEKMHTIPSQFITLRERESDKLSILPEQYVKISSWDDVINLSFAEVSHKDEKGCTRPKGINIEFYYEESEEAEKNNKKNKHYKSDKRSLKSKKY